MHRHARELAPDTSLLDDPLGGRVTALDGAPDGRSVACVCVAGAADALQLILAVGKADHVPLEPEMSAR